MVKNDSLSSDIDLIKELESLRIKQKLLVETLSKENSTHEIKTLSHIDGKLDFLVKIFQESTSSETSQDEKNKQVEKEKSHENFEIKLFEKLESIEESMNAKFEDILEKISNLESNKINSKLPSDVSKTQTTDKIQSDSKSIDKNNSKSSVEINSETIPPIPNFGEENTSEKPVENNKSIETKSQDSKNSTSSTNLIEPEKEKKKKWF